MILVMKRVLEVLAILALVSLVVFWQRQPQEEDYELVEAAPPVSAAPVQELARCCVDDRFLGEETTASAVVKLDDSGRVASVRGAELTRGAEKLFGVGASHDQVKEALGPANAFAHGGRCWGYWQNNWLPKGSGILIKFSSQGVTEIVMARDWSELATELALDGINGDAEPVDGSDGYQDLRDWAERSKK